MRCLYGFMAMEHPLITAMVERGEWCRQHCSVINDRALAHSFIFHTQIFPCTSTSTESVEHFDNFFLLYFLDSFFQCLCNVAVQWGSEFELKRGANGIIITNSSSTNERDCLPFGALGSVAIHSSIRARWFGCTLPDNRIGLIVPVSVRQFVYDGPTWCW